VERRVAAEVQDHQDPRKPTHANGWIPPEPTPAFIKDLNFKCMELAVQ
jgi:hypothetical protein